MKVVLNMQQEGLHLSHAAVLRYCELKGMDIYHRVDDTSQEVYKDDNPHNPELNVDYYLTANMKEDWYPENIERNNPLLIQVVEEMGKIAGGEYGEFEIIEIPDGVKFWIEENPENKEGEWIVEKTRTWDENGPYAVPDPPSKLERLKQLDELMCRASKDGVFKSPDKLIDILRDLRDAIIIEEQSNTKEGE